MNTQAATRLQGLHDILPPPMLQEANWSHSILLACLAMIIVIAVLAWYHWRNTPQQRCRRDYRRLSKRLDKITSAKAGEILQGILLRHFGLTHLDHCAGLITDKGISLDDWQILVSMIHRARFSGRSRTELQTAMQMAQQILWSHHT